MTIAQKNRVFVAGLLLALLIVSLAPAKAEAPTLEMDVELCPALL